MAKANLVTPDGTKVIIEGTAEEVAGILGKFSELKPAKSKRKRKRSASRGSGVRIKRKDGPTGLIKKLADEGYFKSKRRINDIQKKLEQDGHIYAMSSISPILIRLTKQRVLRRLKENKVWVYVQ